MGVDCNSKCKCENCLNGKHGGDAGDEAGELAGEFATFTDAHILLDGVQEHQPDAPRHYAAGGMSASGARDASISLIEMHNLMCSEDLPMIAHQGALHVTSVEVLPAHYAG